MPSPNIVKVVSRFPFVAQDQTLSSSGIPGDTDLSQNAYILNHGTGGRDPSVVTFDRIMQRLMINRTHGDMPITGASLAPDSPIGQVLLLPGGNNASSQAYEVNAQNPYVGDFDGYDQISIAPRIGIPGLSTLNNYVWDGSLLAGGGSTLWTLPVRLYLWYGVIPRPSSGRAPYNAHARFQMTGPDTANMIVCVDGRTRIEVYYLPTTTTSTITIAGSISMVPGSVDASPTFVQILQQVNPGIALHKHYITSLTTSGNDSLSAPWHLINITVNDTAVGGNGLGHQVLVRAYDGGN